MASNAALHTGRRPHGPRGHRLFGNLRDLNRDQLGFYDACAREYGDVVPVRLGPSGGLLVYHPDAIEEGVRDAEPRFHQEPRRPPADGLGRRLPRFACYPFGGGPRQCIGNTFATMEAALILAAIARRFRPALSPGQRMTSVPYVTLRPGRGIQMRVEAR